jgi:serine/threonine protein kinase
MHINDIFNIKCYNKTDMPRYEFIKELAEGGMGKVSLIRDNDLNREIAMKTLHSSLKTDEGRSVSNSSSLELLRDEV